MFSSFLGGVADGICLGFGTPPGRGPRVLIVRIVWKSDLQTAPQSQETTKTLRRFFTQTLQGESARQEGIGWNLFYPLCRA